MKKKIFVIFSISLVILFLFSVCVYFFVYPRKYENQIVAFSEKFNLEKELVYAIVKVESNFKSDAVSKSGALGLMQILPKTAKWIAEELGEDYSDENMFEPEINIRFGCFYLRYLFDKFEDLDIVVCAYNAGEGKVQDWIKNGILDRNEIDYSETKNYLERVEKFYKVYKNRLINFWWS